MDGRRIGWDHLGSAITTGDPDLDALISEVQEVEDTGRYDAIPTTLNPWIPTTHPTEQIMGGFVIREDGSILRRGGRLNLTWAAVALPSWDQLLTIGDVSLILGVTTGTLHSYISRNLPKGNRIPEPDMITGWSNNRPLRLWMKISILEWMGNRPGRGFRTDKSTIPISDNAGLDLIAHMSTTELISYLNRRSARTKFYPPLTALHPADAEDTRALDDGTQTVIVSAYDILRWDNLAWIQRRGRCELQYDGCTTRGMEHLHTYNRAVSPYDPPTTVIACEPCFEELGNRI
jgi:hypothetical protein